MLYGVNDISDYDTDKLNPKKQDYEALVLPQERKGLIWLIVVTSLPFALVLVSSVWGPALPYLLVFLALSIFYSLPPVRAKTRPLIDSAFNVLYAMPGFFGWSLAGGRSVSMPILLASAAWTMAMHAFSAVPDIESDRGASITTIATKLGRSTTIIVCLALYAVAAALSYQCLGYAAVFIGAVYAFLMTMALMARSERGIMNLYQLFPLVNTAAGGLIFCTIYILKHAKM